MKSFTLCLPIPPSTNNLFINIPRRGRVISAKYREWRAEANSMAMQQAPLERFDCPVRITIEVGRLTKRKADIDGKLKAPIDMLVELGIIPADDWSIVREVTGRWDFESSVCLVTVEEL